MDKKIKDISISYYKWWKSNVKPYKWHSCSDCSYHFRCEKDLEKHMWIYHNKGSGEIFACNLCNKEFKIKDQLTKHIWNKHR